MFRRIPTARVAPAVRTYVTKDNHHGHGEASFTEVFLLFSGVACALKFISISGEK